MHHTRIDHTAWSQLIRAPIRNPAPIPIVKSAKPSNKRREFATDKAVIGGRRKKIEPGCRVFNWLSWNRYIAPAMQANANAPHATIENDVCASSQGLTFILAVTVSAGGMRIATIKSAEATGAVKAPINESR